jgi:alpha-D-xyloside xylohydrolase
MNSLSVAATPVAAGIWRIRLGEPEPITPVRVRASVPRAADLPAVAAPPLDPRQITFRVSARGCVVTLPLDRDEGLFGLGLQLKSHLQTGRKKTLRVNSDPVADTGDSHAPVPFYVSTAGYGVLVDTGRYASFYLGTHVPAAQWEERAREKDQTIAIGTADLYKHRATSARVVVDIPVARGVDLYLFAGPTLSAAVQRYNLFSGGGCLPPLWGLGGWYRCHGQSTATEVLALADRLRRDEIPMDVLGLEPGWQTHSYPCSFVWSPERFPQPAELIATARRRGYRLNLWEHAFVHPAAPFAAAIRPHCGDELAFDGLVPDFLDAEAQRIFAEHHERTLVAAGIAGFKLDECDHSDFLKYAWSFPEWTRFPSGADGEQMHSLYGIRYQQTVDAVFRRHNRRHYSEARSAHALAAGLPFVLYSDLYDYRDFLRGVVNAGFSGLLWCPEVRHADSLDDLVRRVQTVVVSPQALVNAWYIKNPPWEENDHLPAAAARQATALVREAFRLRMRLLPYLYAAFARYWETGQPPFRALVMDAPADRATWEIDDQFLIGDALLAAPVAPGQTERSVYLPAGQWHDFATGQKLEGGRRHCFPAPLEWIPLFVRTGTVLPLAEPVPAVTPDTVFQITPRVFGDDAARGWLFDDDGETYGYEAGDATWIELAWTRGGGPQIKYQRPRAQSRYRIGAFAV